jgi:hypothetical protein
VVELEHDQRDAPEKDLRLAHGGSLGIGHVGVNGPDGLSSQYQLGSKSSALRRVS